MSRQDWTISSTSGAFLATAATLQLNNLAPDTLAFDCPGTSFNVGDPVNLRHGNRLVFQGKIHTRGTDATRGTTLERQYTARGPWQTLDDIIYRQQWQALGIQGPAAQYFSRVILNQRATGAPMKLRDQLLDILQPAIDANAITLGTITVPDIYLPSDEQRSITLAQALLRCLRIFPALATWFDYTTPTPAIHIGKGTPANWLDNPTLRSTLLTEEQSGTPPAGVVLEIETTGDFNGSTYRKVTTQEAGNISNPSRVLFIPLDLQGSSGNVTSASLDVETEDIPDDWQTNITWWQKKHPRLANADIGYLTIKDATRTGNYPRLAKTPMKDIENAGLRAALDTFTVKATIKTMDAEHVAIDIERDILLTMKFVTTTAQTRRYSWTESSSFTAGEWIPDGLANAILEQHRYDGQSLTIVARPDTTFWVTPGQTRNGLICQNVSYTIGTDLMDITFGPPAQLTPQDLAGLMTGWRNIRRASSSYSRATGEPEQDAKVDYSTVAPVEATDSSDGPKSKIGAYVGNQKASIDPTLLPPEKPTAELRKMEFVTTGTDGKQYKTEAFILANEPTQGEEVKAGKCDCPCCDPDGDGSTETECVHRTNPDGSGGGGGGGGTAGDGRDGQHPGLGGGGGGGGHEDREHPGKSGPCW